MSRPKGVPKFYMVRYFTPGSGNDQHDCMSADMQESRYHGVIYDEDDNSRVFATTDKKKAQARADSLKELWPSCDYWVVSL